MGNGTIPLMAPEDFATTTGQGGNPDEGCPGGVAYCLTRLSGAHKDLLNSAGSFFKTTFANPADQTFCQSLLTNALSRVNTTMLGQNWPWWLGDSHAANTTLGLIHIDKDQFDSANADPNYRKYVITIFLHEVLHASGEPPHTESSPPYSTGNFARLNFNPSNACVAGPWN